MSSRLGLLGVAVAAFTLVPAAAALACDGEGSPAGTLTARAYARTVECVLNVERARHGLPALVHDRRLARAARRYSRAMVRERFFDHVSPAGSTLGRRARASGYAGRSLGETIAWGSGELSTPASIVDQWMLSAPHRQIILHAAFRRFGLGVANGSPEGISGAATVTADFGG